MKDKLTLIILGVLTALGYITITIFLPIPTFIKYENILYASLYILFTYIAIRKTNIPLLTLIFFNIGRISRSIITSYGEVARLALEHLPLLIYLIIYGLYIAYLSWKE